MKATSYVYILISRDIINSNNSSLKSKLNLGDFSYHTYSFLEKSISYYSYIKN